MMSGSQFSMPAKIASSTKKYNYLPFAKNITTFCKGVTRNFVEDLYEIEIDGQKILGNSGSNHV